MNNYKKERYYFMQINSSFFNEHTIIEIGERGAEQLIAYFKLMLISLNTGGVIRIRNNIKVTNNYLARLIGVDEALINLLVPVLIETGMIVEQEDGSIFFPEVPQVTATLSPDALKMREWREGKANNKPSSNSKIINELQTSNNVITMLPQVDNINKEEKKPLKEKEIDLDKDVEIDVDKDVEVEKDGNLKSLKDKSIKKNNNSLAAGLKINAFTEELIKSHPNIDFSNSITDLDLYIKNKSDEIINANLGMKSKMHDGLNHFYIALHYVARRLPADCGNIAKYIAKSVNSELLRPYPRTSLFEDLYQYNEREKQIYDNASVTLCIKNEEKYQEMQK